MPEWHIWRVGVTGKHARGTGRDSRVTDSNRSMLEVKKTYAGSNPALAINNGIACRRRKAKP